METRPETRPDGSIETLIKRILESLHEQDLPAQASMDALPSVDELAAREETVKVTITLSKLSVEFFKQEARARRTQYQKMIRRLLDEYVQRQSQFGHQG